MNQTLLATCPSCRHKLHVPAKLVRQFFRCKYCGQLLRASGLPGQAPPELVGAAARIAKPLAPVNEASPPELELLPPSDENGRNVYLSQLRQRRKVRGWIQLAMAGVVLLGLGLTAFLLRDKIRAQFEKTVLASHADTSPKNIEPSDPGPSISTRPKPPPAQSPKFTPRYSGRALLIGVKNYVSAPPLNPRYNPEASELRDPLGLASFRKMLVQDLGFPEVQVAELSDAAQQNPVAPMKATIEESVAGFLDSSRPVDRIVLVFVGHLVELDGKGFLMPLDGEPEEADTLLAIGSLYERLSKCPARQKVLVLDVARHDPSSGLAAEPLSEKVVKQFKDEVPLGVQVWLSCSAGQQSYEFPGADLAGSLFLHYIVNLCQDLKKPEQWKQWREREGFQNNSLPFLVLEPEIKTQIEKECEDKGVAKQSPLLFGSEGAGPDPEPKLPPPPRVAIKIPEGTDPPADPRLVDGLLEELQNLKLADNQRPLTRSSLPPFWAKAMEPYKPDYANEEQLQEKLASSPLRKATVEAAAILAAATGSSRNYPDGFRKLANETQFREEITRVQEKVAFDVEKLGDALAKLEKVEKERDDEISPRWRAHYDYVYARVLGRLIYVQEYNFVVGNKLKKDNPPLMKPAENDGWNLVPEEKIQQKETRELDERRKIIIGRLLKEHPKTPWEVLTRAEKNAKMSLAIEEGKVR